jgi:hypothetical protein
VDGSCEHGNEPSGFLNVRNFFSRCASGGLSRSAYVRGGCLVSNLLIAVDKCNVLCSLFVKTDIFKKLKMLTQNVNVKISL